MKGLRMMVVLLLATTSLHAQGPAQIPETLSYQSYMTNADGAPIDSTVSLMFALYDVIEGGEPIWTESQPAVPVSAGVLSTTLGHAESLEDVSFDRPLWLEVTFDAGGKTGVNGTRMPLNSVPFAMAVRGIRYIPGAAPGLIGGYAGNFIGETAPGATIGGGGRSDDENAIENGGEYATIGGGNGNLISGGFATIGGGGANHAEGIFSTISGGGANAAFDHATVGGGFNNKALGAQATISGGNGNQANDLGATVGGGTNNVSDGNSSTVGGGSYNQASAEGATVPGGLFNVAAGKLSLAAGFHARANHDGAFVWSGKLNDIAGDFESTDANQFLIRAPNGVGIGTNEPMGALHVVRSDQFQPSIVLGGFDESRSTGILRSDPLYRHSGILLNANGNVAVSIDDDNNDANFEIIPEFTVSRGGGDVLLRVDGGNGTTSVSNLSASGSVEGSNLSATGEVEGAELHAVEPLGSNITPHVGGVYSDNVIYAWATVSDIGKPTSKFGCDASRIAEGVYAVKFSRALPEGVTTVVTPLANGDPVLASVDPSASGADVHMHVFDGGTFKAADAGFTILVVGRP